MGKLTEEQENKIIGEEIIPEIVRLIKEKLPEVQQPIEMTINYRPDGKLVCLSRRVYNPEGVVAPVKMLMMTKPETEDPYKIEDEGEERMITKASDGKRMTLKEFFEEIKNSSPKPFK